MCRESLHKGNFINPFQKTFIQTASVMASLAFLSLAFNNCGKVNVENIEQQKASGLTGGPGGQGFSDPQGLIATCLEAKSAGKIRSLQLKGAFPDPKKQCDWGVGGNLSQVNGLVRARIDQVQNIQIPPGATVCNIKMESTLVSRFYYDDNVILTLNGLILASTSDFSRHFQNQRGYSVYDWNRLIGKPAQNAGEDTTPEKQYCAGEKEGVSSCQFPKTETNGTAQLAFGESVIQTVLGMTNPHQVNLTLITTGDNDSTDCQHVPIDLNLDVEYFTP